MIEPAVKIRSDKIGGEIHAIRIGQLYQIR